MQLLTLEEYRSTITPKMFEVKDTSEPTVDIWPYVQKLADDKIISEDVAQNKLIDGIYRNSDNTFEHIQLPTQDSDIFTFIVINLGLGTIKGHFYLDL